MLPQMRRLLSPGLAPRWCLIAVAAASMFLTAVGSARADITIGAPSVNVTPDSGNGCGTPPCVFSDALIPSRMVSSPVNGTVTGWGVRITSNGTSVQLRLIRPLSGSPMFLFAGSSTSQASLATGPHVSLPAAVPISIGDTIGVEILGSGSIGASTVSGAEGQFFQPAPADATSASPNFNSADTEYLVNATIKPSNSFTVTGIAPTKKGTATLAFNLPNAGDLTGSGQGAQVASTGAVTSKAVPAGTATLVVKATGKKKRKLNEKGKVKLNLAVTYTPTGGDPSTQSVKVKLHKKV
jgi:hypothetical protein